MNIELTLNQTRVIGSLMEKAIATPNQYPLSLNALVGACNQKSNREPVLSLDEVTVQDVVDELIMRHLVSAKSGFGSRVAKYGHRFLNSEFGFRLTEQDAAIVCVLLLRGPQTPGELRTRTQRLCDFSNTREVEATLKQLMDYPEGPFLTKLPRESGRRESRYAHLFSGEVHVPQPVVALTSPATATPRADDNRLDRLEHEVEELRREIADIKQQLEGARSRE
ncbi:MAG: DUF480 domain-containing protein [Pseudomonadales bacterium]